MPPTATVPIVDETFELTSSDSNTTGANGVAATWTDVWRYQVPTGIGHVIRPNDVISAYLYDTTLAAEAAVGTTQLRIEVRDQSEQDKKVIYGPVLYSLVREFVDQNKIAHLSLEKAMAVRERYWIVVLAKGTNALTVASSYFALSMKRIRTSLP